MRKTDIYSKQAQAMASLSSIDAGAGKPLRVHSLWSILQRGYEVNPNQTALVAPTQPAGHLEGLVGSPTSSTTGYDTRPCRLILRQVAARLTCLVSRMLLPSPTSNGNLVWSFAQLRRGAVRLGSVIDANGIPHRSTVLVVVPSCAEWALMLWVSALQCYTLITLDTAVLETGQEQKLHDYISRLNPSVVVVQRQEDAMVVDQVRNKTSKSPFMGITLASLAKPQPNWTSMSDISARKFPQHPKANPPPEDDANRVAMIVFTSGSSTGKPKGCVRTVGDLLRPLSAGSWVPSLRPPTVLVNTKSSQSLAPCLLYSMWYSGNAAVLAGGNLNAATTIYTMATCRPIAVALYPHTIDDVTKHADVSPEKIKSIRFLLVMGSVTTVESIRRAQRLFPKAKVIPSYGMTEAAGMFGWPRGQPALKETAAYKGIVSSGMPLPGLKLKIVNEDGKVVARNEAGMLHLCGDMVAAGYFDDDYSKSFYMEGDNRWYVTGDCAVLNKRKRVFILGRYENMIKRDGIIIAPATIENLLMKYFPKSTIVVVSIPTKENREAVYAVFQHAVQNRQTVEDLVLQRLGRDYQLDGVLDLPQLQLSNWPYTMVGKLSIADLRVMVGEYVAPLKMTQ